VNHWHSIYDSAYLRDLVLMPDVEIVGVHDDDPEVARHRVAEIESAAPTFTDYDRMLDSVSPDFVLALGSHDTMAETAHHLLDRSIPYVMEKPMSFSARQLRAVVDKAEGGFAAAPLNNRYSPIIAMAKKLAQDGTYGPMTHFYSRINRPTLQRYIEWDSGWLLDPSRSNGGCLRNLGNHGLDAFVYLTEDGENVRVNGAQLSWGTHGQPVEDYASVLVESSTGVLGTIETGNGFPWDGTDGQWKVAFRDAILVANGDVLTLETVDGRQTIPPARGPAPSLLRMTVEAAANGEKPPVSAHDCYLAVRLIDLAYIAAGNPYGTAEV
jgi:predicted dehydrogenase